MPTDRMAPQESQRERGLLVAVEGIDGAGKTTQVRALRTLLERAGVPCFTTKEPTGGSWGQKIRNSAIHGRMPPDEELAAFLADRREHVATVLEPSLSQGLVVLVDRYFLSTVAYQGARGLDPQMLLTVNAFAPEPDILIILDVPPKVGLARVGERGDVADLFEKEDELGRAREIFRGLERPNTTLLDGTLSQAVLSRQIADVVFARLGLSVPMDSSHPPKESLA